jgi:hypothetical protein
MDFTTWAAAANDAVQNTARAAGVDIVAEWDAVRARWTCDDRWIAAVPSAGMKFVGIKFSDGRDMAWPVLGGDSASENGTRIASLLIDRMVDFKRFAALRDEVREIVGELVPGVEYIERQEDAVAWRFRDRVATMALITQQTPIGEIGVVHFAGRTQHTEALNFPAENIAAVLSETLTRDA